MNIDLNEVEDGFIQRWFEQALVLIMKNSLAWIFLMSMLGISSLIEINVFYKSFIGLFFMLLGIELSIASELKQSIFKTIATIIKKSFEGLFLQIYFKVIFYTLMFLVFVFVSKNTGNLQNQSHEHSWLTDVYWVYGLGLISLSGIGFQIYTHLYSRFFESVDKRLVNYNCKLAAKINYKVEIFFTVFIVSNVTIVSMFFPLLVIMLYPIACTLIYVSFKEIFLNKNRNKIRSSLVKEMDSVKLG